MFSPHVNIMYTICSGFTQSDYAAPLLKTESHNGKFFSANTKRQTSLNSGTFAPQMFTGKQIYHNIHTYIGGIV